MLLPLLLALLCPAAAAVGAAYSCSAGAGLAGGDLRQAEGLTLAQAEAWCSANASCAAFTLAANASSGGNASCGTLAPSSVLSKVYFKEGQSANSDSSWLFFLRANYTPPFLPRPSYRGCDAPPGSLLPWCNRSKPHEERLELLVGELTLAEKIALCSPQRRASGLGNPCNTHTLGVPRLGLTDYMWLEESNTGVSSSCLGPGHCATTFAGPLGLGASFNRTSWRLKGTVIGNEMRAMNNIGWYRDAGGTVTEKIGLTGYVSAATVAAAIFHTLA